MNGHILTKPSRLSRFGDPSAAYEKLAALGLHGAQGGLHMRSDVVETVAGTAVTLDGQPLSEVWADLQSRLAVYNRQVDFVFSLFTFPVDRAQDRVAVWGTPKFERATELGRPQKTRITYIFRGFPLTHHDLSFGFTQEFIDSARGSEIEGTRLSVEFAWRNLLMNSVLDAIFQPANLTDEDGVVVRRLYNNDGEDPPNYQRFTHAGTHTHYLTSAGAAPAGFDAADLNAMEEHLLHHGYGDNGETLILLANRAQMPTIRALATFVPAASADIPTIINGEVIGQTRASIPGLRAQGYHGQLVVVENNYIPADYFLAIATGGTFSQQNPVGYRRHENPSARGLRLVEGPRQNYPIIDSVYDGYAGFGVRHRGAAVVMQVTAGAYAAPSLL